MSITISPKHPTADPHAPADLSGYSRRQRFVIRLAAVAAYIVLRLIGLTLRWERRDPPDDKRGGVPPGTPVIYSFWHNRILGCTVYYRHLGIVVMTSQSFDGEIIARMIQMFGYGAARGSATRGSVRALKNMARCLREGRDVAFTIDGPKGPRHEAKAGAVMLARLSGAPIVPVCVTTNKYWELNSWDRFRIPKPFARARAAYAEPIEVSRDADDMELEAKQRLFQAALDRLEAESMEWTTKC